MLIDRQRAYACIHPETYKYYFDAASVLDVWRRLAERYGPIEKLSGFGSIRIDAPRLHFRAIAGGNPITVIRKRRCTHDDIHELHTLLDCLEAVARFDRADGESLAACGRAVDRRAC